MGCNSPCASCKLLRRRCSKDCIFAPYFPSDDPHKFAIVHKVFGASNVSKMLQELPLEQRADAVSSLVYEANARVRDPVYGCVGVISYLQDQVSQLQMQLAMAQAEMLMYIQMHHHRRRRRHYASSSRTTQLRFDEAVNYDDEYEDDDDDNPINMLQNKLFDFDGDGINVFYDDEYSYKNEQSLSLDVI